MSSRSSLVQSCYRTQLTLNAGLSHIWVANGPQGRYWPEIRKYELHAMK